MQANFPLGRRYQLPLPRPMLLGTVLTCFNNVSGLLAAPQATQWFMNGVHLSVQTKLVPALMDITGADRGEADDAPKVTLVPAREHFVAAGVLDYNLMLLRDFVSRNVYSQEFGISAPFLTQDIIKYINHWAAASALEQMGDGRHAYFKLKVDAQLQHRLTDIQRQVRQFADAVLYLIGASVSPVEAGRFMAGRDRDFVLHVRPLSTIPKHGEYPIPGPLDSCPVWL
jgi:hypothetical protein